MARINNFIRFMESMKVKSEKRVVNITITPMLSDCTGSLYVTDLQLQEGSMLTGYTPHTEGMLLKPEETARYHNGIIRGSTIVIIPTQGETSTALDVCLYPNQPMSSGSIEVGKGAGSHRMRFLDPISAGDALTLSGTDRRCLRNGQPALKHGFYQYTAAHDSKHYVKLESGKSARVYFEYHERKGGEPRP